MTAPRVGVSSNDAYTPATAQVGEGARVTAPPECAKTNTIEERENALAPELRLGDARVPRGEMLHQNFGSMIIF